MRELAAHRQQVSKSRLAAAVDGVPALPAEAPQGLTMLAAGREFDPEQLAHRRKLIGSSSHWRGGLKTGLRRHSSAWGSAL